MRRVCLTLALCAMPAVASAQAQGCPPPASAGVTLVLPMGQASGRRLRIDLGTLRLDGTPTDCGVAFVPQPEQASPGLPPRDVLHGDGPPDQVLHGPPAADLLRGPGPTPAVRP